MCHVISSAFLNSGVSHLVYGVCDDMRSGSVGKPPGGVHVATFYEITQLVASMT